MKPLLPIPLPPWLSRRLPLWWRRRRWERMERNLDAAEQRIRAAMGLR